MTEMLNAQVSLCSVHDQISFLTQLQMHIQADSKQIVWQIVCQADYRVFEPLHHRLNPSVYLHTPCALLPIVDTTLSAWVARGVCVHSIFSQ